MFPKQIVQVAADYLISNMKKQKNVEFEFWTKTSVRGDYVRVILYRAKLACNILFTSAKCLKNIFIILKLVFIFQG